MRGKRGSISQSKASLRQTKRVGSVIVLMVLAALLPVLVVTWFAANGTTAVSAAHTPIGPRTYPPTSQHAALPHHRVYSVEKQSQGYMLMDADTTGAAKPVTLLPNSFGSDATDVVAALALSPNQQYLAIDAQQDHGDFVWIVATATNQLRTTPDDAIGNFVRWMPDGTHFLFRPFLPTRNDGTWNPGLWIVDAGTGAHINLTLPNGLPATDLADAAPAPDGTQIVLSVTTGLGQGSTVWLASPDGMQMQPLFQSTADVGLFAWSPDGQQIAYETIADSSVPFRPAGLWVMSATGTAQHQIATADGGHGYAPAWSPDGTQLAFVTRLNPTDSTANGMAGALVSAVQMATLADGRITTVAAPAQTGTPRNIDPIWQADGTLLFTAMGASSDFGAALSSSTLWQAAPTAVTTQHPSTLQLTPIRQHLTSPTTAFVTIVP